MMKDFLMRKLSKDERRDFLMNKYKIAIDDDTLYSLERIEMSIGEEVRNYERREGAHDQARIDRLKSIDDYSESVISAMFQFKMDLDDIILAFNVPMDIREDVRNNILGRTSQ